MEGYYRKKIDNDKRYTALVVSEEAKRKYKRTCEFCGWDNYLIRHEEPVPRKSCKNCGHTIFLNDKEKFKYKMEMKMRGVKNV